MRYVAGARVLLGVRFAPVDSRCEFGRCTRKPNATQLEYVALFIAPFREPRAPRCRRRNTHHVSYIYINVSVGFFGSKLTKLDCFPSLAPLPTLHWPNFSAQARHFRPIRQNHQFLTISTFSGLGPLKPPRVCANTLLAPRTITTW